MADKAIRKGYTKRYLPESAWAKLSKEEREETDRKKRSGSRKGKQFFTLDPLRLITDYIIFVSTNIEVFTILTVSLMKL
jgi:hypothetical protein